MENNKNDYGDDGIDLSGHSDFILTVYNKFSAELVLIIYDAFLQRFCPITLNLRLCKFKVFLRKYKYTKKNHCVF